MKAQLFLCGLLFVSVAVNFSLWKQLANREYQLRTIQTRVDQSGQENPKLQSAQNASAVDLHQLARLRNEVGQLRRHAEEALAENAELRKRLGEVAETLASTQSELAEAIKRSPEEWQRMIQEGQTSKCVNHLKQICVAAWMWADDHNQVFPPDFISMQQDLSEPELLFCPADTDFPTITQWQQLNPSSISYRWLNPNGSHDYSTNPLVSCPIHGHFVLSDGSIHRR